MAGLCASYAQAVADTLVEKPRRALLRLQGQGQLPSLRSIILAGGVAAARRLREAVAALGRNFSLPCIVPAPALCTDNAAMIAYTGSLLLEAGLRHELNFPVIPRGRVVPDDYVKNFV